MGRSSIDEGSEMIAEQKTSSEFVSPDSTSHYGQTAPSTQAHAQYVVIDESLSLELLFTGAVLYYSSG